MVPEKIDDIPAATCLAIERLLDRLGRDRESLGQCGYAGDSLEMIRLNTLADTADELKKALLAISEPGDNDNSGDINGSSSNSGAGSHSGANE